MFVHRAMMPSAWSLEETRKCFQGGKGAVPPQFWSAINFNRPKRGEFFSPPKYLDPQRLIANLQYLRRFAAF